MSVNKPDAKAEMADARLRELLELYQEGSPHEAWTELAVMARCERADDLMDLVFAALTKLAVLRRAGLEIVDLTDEIPSYPWPSEVP